ncbi:hypothetical protein FIBSPDRAFT_875675 [Athelia psychrophila]|uniref:SH3 domain-containing protein n=1 Tax=Athelia psychrophila TaxID=1759441 RepID=A0A167XJ97_9AGAM|nr:hypothetical protein FIBSPDRAFT_875675 [Fibularhizoctonia sp. CBS 109695]
MGYSSASIQLDPCTAKALYSYTASPDDPHEISFIEGEVFDIIDKRENWWRTKKADGTIGIVPSNHFVTL